MKGKKGFTLIELLVVIAIIGLLSTLAVVSLSSARRKSRDSKRIADIKQIQMALEMYYDDKNGYPVVASAVVLGSNGNEKLCDHATTPGFVDDTATCTNTYMGVVPAAPTPADNCTTAQNNYTYDDTSTGAGYSITFCLGGKTGSLNAGTHTATEAGIQ